MTVFQRLESIREQRGAVALALLDPDSKNDHQLQEMTARVAASGFDAILVGGSLIMDNRFDQRIELIRSICDLPVIIFPGSSRQLSARADAILFLSLLSGRNPQYLIGEQVQSAPTIYSMGLETIPTGYLLLDGGSRSAVEIMSHTAPLPMDKQDIVLAHTLAAQYLGMKMIFLEAGSGAVIHAGVKLLEYIIPYLDIPVIVGGGVRSADSAAELVSAGAAYVVIGTILEENPTADFLKKLTTVIHHRDS